MALRSRLRDFVAPEAGHEPLFRYREGAPALASFAAFVLLLCPLGAALFAVADAEHQPVWYVPLVIGVAAFACAFLLPRRRRRLVGVVVASVYVAALLLALVALIFLLVAFGDCLVSGDQCIS